ncbi:MAG: NUDIX hydrolase [Balneolales bacterium]|nr:NUDIX hydrolase [Balneolales bacterium]
MGNKKLEWETTSKKIICKTRVFEVVQKIMRPLDLRGKEAEFSTLYAPDWINVVAVSSAGEVLLVKQFRYGTERLSLEIPGGVIDPDDENPLYTAKRELMEETGYTAKKWSKLGVITSNPALFNNSCHVFLAEECKQTHQQQLDEHERIELIKLSLDDFFNRIKNGEIDHALAVAAAGLFLLHKRVSLDV